MIKLIYIVVICMALRPFGINYPVYTAFIAFLQYIQCREGPKKEHPPATQPTKFLCRGTAKTARTDSANERVNGPTEKDTKGACYTREV